eukprot:1833219-Ditylum_brightwellii.AAC.1
MDCDTKACYNRVILTLATLLQIQAGLPLMAAQFFLQILTQLKYLVVTSYGFSDIGVTHKETYPIHGLGQGITDALPNWALISNVCQKAYEKHRKGYRIIDPAGTI